MLAKDIMITDVITVKPDTTVEDVARLLIDKKIAGVPVVNDENKVIGIVSESDVLRKKIEPASPSILGIFTAMFHEKKAKEYQTELKKMTARTASEIMTSPVISVEAGEDVISVGKVVLDHNIKRVPVTEFGKLVGLISRADLVKLVLNP